ncbi:hypothetical protein HY633_05065 [Candidatus Uhrbacteria bacterium]|nr:hypothetical protein [Candidatus Uhrbacteria bacterium]
MRTLLRLIGFLAGTAWLAMAPAALAETSVYANGGAYFTASGPSAYWRYDSGQGYCGQFGTWCSPANSQWTWSTSTYGGVNNAVWNVIPIDRYSRAYAFIPRRNATTRGAKYTVAYNWVSRRSSEIDQMRYYDQWVPLAFGDQLRRIHSVDLTDSTFEATATRVNFDEIKIEN